jgi:ABC-type oligopeptide transport system substrate-binding subunit
MIGALLNQRYQIEAEIGRGGMGVVYCARDTLLKRDVAIKMMSAGSMGTSGRARLLREARSAASLNHPNIVAIHDVGETELPGQTEITPFIIMELVEGQSLRDFKPSSLEEVVEIGLQICIALEQAHLGGIIHGDLKPENIVVTPAKSVKLMDFGLARIAGQKEIDPDGTVTGTLSYLPPEVILGHPTSKQSDFYALGVIFYELSTDHPPFEGENIAAMLSQQLNSVVVPPSTHNNQIPLALDNLILKLLSKQPEDRPDSAKAIQQELEDWHRHELTTIPEAVGDYGLIGRLASGRVVGRQSELAQVMALWRRAAGSEGQVLFISGEPGVGKTRLVRELIAFVQLSGGSVWTSECYQEGTSPYGPLSQLIRGMLRDDIDLQLPDYVLSDLLRLVPDLRSNFPDIPTGEPLEPEAERMRLFESVLALWHKMSEIGPVLTFIDDIHWADSGTISLLGQLAHHASHQKMMIVATYREVELHQSQAFQELLANLYRDHLVTRIKLPRLTANQTGELLETLFSEEVTAEFVQSVHLETEGNPFFIEEVCKALVDQGQIYFAEGRWQRAKGGLPNIPQGVRVAIHSRLARLSAAEQEILHLAALLGREFNYDLLKTICSMIAGIDEDELIDALDSAEQAQIIAEAKPTNPDLLGRPVSIHHPLAFSFTHGLIHSALLSDLSTLRRQRMQRKVALALEQSFPDQLDELGPLLGRYFAEAGEADKAVKYLLSAGDAARRLYAYEEAIEAYEQALLFLKEQEQIDQAARTLMNLGLIYHNTFQFEKSQQAYEEGFGLWKQTATGAVQILELDLASKQQLSIHLHSPRTLDPAKCTDGVSEIYIRQFFSGLVELGPNGEILPGSAESWEVLNDGRRYVFHLGQNSLWSDGKRLTASDFEYAWKRALNPEMGTDAASFLHDIKGAKAYNMGEMDAPEKIGVFAPDPITLVVDLEGPTSYFLQGLTRGVTMPVPQHAVQLQGEDWAEPGNIITNGPFKPEKWLSGKRSTLKRNQSFSGRFDGNVERVFIEMNPKAPLLEIYENGELDVLRLNDLPLSEAESARYKYANEYLTLPVAVTSYLAFDTFSEPFDDPIVRRAFALSIDKSRLANRHLRGQASAATGGFVPPGIPGHVPGIGSFFDVDKARKLMTSAGYPNGHGFPSLEFLVVRHSDSETDPYNLELQALWQRILGVTVIIRELWFAEFLERLENKKPAIWKSGWAADYPDPDSFLRACPARHASNWSNQRYEELVEEAKRLADPVKRRAMYRDAEEILTEEMPLIPLSYSREHLLLKPWIKKYPIEPVGGLFYKDVVVIDKS